MLQPINIPVNKQKLTAVGGIDIVHLTANTDYPKGLRDHRDEYYVLAIVTQGTGLIKCDMGIITFKPSSVLLVKPLQVHSSKQIDADSEGFFISIAPFLLPSFCRNVFDSLNVADQCTQLTSSDMNDLLKMAEVLYKTFNGDQQFKAQLSVNLLNAIVIYACSFFSQSKQIPVQQQSQPFILTQSFKALVLIESFLHSPSYFAEKLHVSVSHLNDCVKATTGVTVTQYLQELMLLEAKRQLYYTNADVKSIAFNLGFEDHAYFSRLFKKLTELTPLAFRVKFRE
jgi:AraC family transcriptional activator of pobA